MEGVLVGEAMHDAPEPLAASSGLPEIAARFANSWETALPVVDDAGCLVGVIAAADIERAAAEGGDASAGSLAQGVPDLHADQEVADAIDLLAEGDREGLPVLADGTRKVSGWIDHRDVLRAYAARFGSTIATDS